MRKAAKSPAAEETPAGLAYDGLDELLGFRIRFAHTAMYRDFAASLEDLDLTQKQVGSLWLIGANPGVSQAALAAALSMDRATMMSIIDRLENGGLVVRKRSVSDRRRQELHLTPAGQKTLTKARNAIGRHERRFASRLSADEFARLLSALRKIS